MKKLLSILLCASVLLSYVSCSAEVSQSAEISETYTSGPLTEQGEGDFSKTAKELTAGMLAGWNLGNTLDACQSWGNISDNPTPEEQETGWNNPVTSQAMLDLVKSSGFDSVRVPVTWGLQLIEDNGTYTIKPEWMNRVKEIVSYCQNAGLYTIVNMHHDDQTWLNVSATDAEWEKIKDKYKQIWEQIAAEFKDYDETLILEGTNEMTATAAYDGCGSGSGKCWWGHSPKVFDRQNEIHQIFVDTVRASGGHNDKRYLMIPTYGAQWYENQISNLAIPNNDNHIIMDIHWYRGSSTNIGENRGYFKIMKKYVDERDIGCVIGECGFQKTVADNTLTNWATNFVAAGKEYGIPCFLWDDGGDMAIMNRDGSPISWNNNTYITSVLAASGYTPLGDANGDGKFSFADVTFTRRHLAKHSGKYATVSELADVDKNGVVNMVDVLYMRKVISKLLPSLNEIFTV